MGLHLFEDRLQWHNLTHSVGIKKDNVTKGTDFCIQGVQDQKCPKNWNNTGIMHF